MKKTILIACLGLVSLGLQAQSISLVGEWNVELGKSIPFTSERNALCLQAQTYQSQTSDKNSFLHLLIIV